MNKVELLAPAGSFEALQAAINAGADAIYLGGNSFGARQYASNFDNEELIRAVDLAHLYRIKIYVTVNTLIDNKELTPLVEYLQFLEMIGVDAIIVQDIGVIELAKKVAPNLHLHASTQMSIMNSSGVEFAEKLGIKRVVLARECSLVELEEIRSLTSLELEVFVHGALCVCYSGQCLMSSLIGGRSGNRGRCAQPCRLQYKLIDDQDQELLSSEDGQYLLSPKDLNTIEIIPELIRAGVTSFKIEGRMKRPEYVAIVVEAYRRAIDSFYENNFQVPEADKRNLTQIFNRDFTTAYLKERPGKTMISDKRPNNRGVQIGRVLRYERASNLVTIKLEEDIQVGDGIEFWVTVGGRVGMNIAYLEVNGEEVTEAFKGQEATFIIPAAVRDSDRVFRTFDSKLMKIAGRFYGESSMKKIPVTAFVEAKVGEPLKITFFDKEGNSGTAISDFLGQVAQKRPLTNETVEKQLIRLGNTAFTLEQWELQADGNVMFPISEINDTRRRASEELYVKRISSYPENKIGKSQEYKLPAPKQRLAIDSKVVVHVDSLDKAKFAILQAADVVILGGENFNHREISIEDCESFVRIAKKAGVKAVLGTPRIVKEFNLAYAQDRLRKMSKLKPDALLIGNLSLIAEAEKYKIPLWLDFGFNTYNSLTIEYWENRGLETILLSPELTLVQIQELASRTKIKLECLVQGRTEMMVSEYCIAGSFMGRIHEKDCYGACSKPMFLLDRMDEKLPVVTDQFCRMHILNAKELSVLGYSQQIQELGINYLRIDARYMNFDEIKKHVKEYKLALVDKQPMPETNNKYTKGHYFRGVL